MAKNNFSHLIGKTVDEAKTLTDFKVRVIKEDDKVWGTSLEFNDKRVNVVVKDGKITEIFNIG